MYNVCCKYSTDQTVHNHELKNMIILWHYVWSQQLPENLQETLTNSHSDSCFMISWTHVKTAIDSNSSVKFWHRHTHCKVTCFSFIMQSDTSNVTGRHRGPKQKLQAVYRVLSLQHKSQRATVFIVECGITHFLCAMHVFKVEASSPFPSLPLYQISFLSRPPLLS